jgi:hypothetical protein
VAFYQSKDDDTSGNLLHNYGKIPFSRCGSSNRWVIFHGYVWLCSITGGYLDPSNSMVQTMDSVKPKAWGDWEILGKNFLGPKI